MLTNAEIQIYICDEGYSYATHTSKNVKQNTKPSMSHLNIVDN